METERGNRRDAERGTGGGNLPGGAEDGASNGIAVRPSPTWRGLAISILVAVVLSVTVTLLLGGSFFRTEVAPAGSGGCCGECPDRAGK